MLKQSLKFKMMALCVFMAVLCLAISVVGYYALHKIENSYERVTDDAAPKLEEVNEMFIEYRRIRIQLRTLGLPGITASQEKEVINEAIEAIEKYEEADKAYRSFPEVAGQKELYDEVHAKWLVFKSVGQKVIELQKKGGPENHEAMIRIFFKDCPDAAKEYTKAMNSLLEFHKKLALDYKKNSEEIANSANTLILLISFFGIALGLVLSFLFATQISRSVLKVVESLAESSDKLASVSNQVATSSTSLSEASVEQAASLEQTASSLEEISAMVAKASTNAKSAASSSSQSQKKAEEGAAAVDKVAQSIDEINQSNLSIMNQVNSSNQKMSEIVQLIQEIGSKTKVINDIVFQTKLLSFNASVEAARAGEQGKGFAVVADEVGKLAQMSGNAAKEISEMLESSIAKTEGIVIETKTKVEELIEEGNGKIQMGVLLVKDCTGILNEIVQNVSSVATLSNEISQASQEQALGVGEINKAVAQLDIVTQQNTTASGETAASATELLSQATTLKNNIKELEDIVKGAS